MHARLHGSWAGTLRSHHGVSGDLHMLVARDSLMRVTYRLRTGRDMRAGEVSNLMFSADSVPWTQHMSGAPCKANAVVSRATSDVPVTMKGTMQCPDGELTFSLHKKTG